MTGDGKLASMKKNLVKTGLLAIISMAFLGVTMSTISWFSNLVVIDNAYGTNTQIEGSTMGAYFAYGNGIPTGDGNKVYGINKPRHLYNLAWLQYLGYFDNKQGGPQFYFEIDPNMEGDLDMSGWVLPPIGTEDHPFVGNFNGNGKTIKNLTVSNNFGDYNTYPNDVSEWNSTNHKQPHILGLFGVVGNYNSKYTVGNAFSTSVIQVKNTGLTNINVKTAVKDSLMGLVAGYVEGSLLNVAVDSGSLDVDKTATEIANNTTTSYPMSNGHGAFTDNISDYTLVGYTTNKTSIKKVTDTIYNVNVQTGQEFNANAQGTGTQGWGGSIDMMSMFQRIDNVRQRNNSTGVTTSLRSRSTSYQYRTTAVYNPNGTTRSSTPTSKTSNALTVRGLGANATIGNFTWVNSNSSSYMYLGGGERFIEDYYDNYHHEGRYITDGTHYLYFDGTELTNTNSSTTATLWIFTLVSGTTYTISTEYNGTTYYLYYNSGNLGIATNPTETYRRLTTTQSGNSLDISYNTSKIYYYDNSWQLVPTGTSTYTDYYYMKSDSNYISASSTASNTPSNTTSESSAAHFYIEDNTNYFYFLNSSNTKLYLMQYYRNNRTPTIQMRTGSANYYYYYTFNGTTLTARANSTNYYVRYNSGWTYTTTSGQAVTPTAHTVTVDFSTYKLSNTLANDPAERDGPDEYLNSTKHKDYYEYTAANTTYFPLNVASDGGTTASSITNGNYRPTDANTGYVIAGTSVPETSTISDGGPSLVRVSQYSKTHNVNNRSQTIKNSFKYSGTSYASGTIADADVLTISSAGQTSLTTAYPDPEHSLEKYASSKSTLLSVLRSSSNNYGLHFMNTQVSTSHIVKATNVSILGESYGDPNDTNEKKRTYEMPVNAIDFNLKEKGYINFFAGTYFSSDVTSFFSIHQIFRDGEANGYAITDIKEIAKIYGNTDHKNWSYAYQYTDGSFSKPYRFTGVNTKYELSNLDPDPETPYVESHSLTSEDFATYETTFGYTELFDTEWITNYSHTTHEKIYNLSQEYLFYFEMPMNSGEFCLGSVYGGAGGYLLYLDIGASAAKTQRTVVAEHYLESIITFSYPDGVALIPTDTIEGTEPTFKASNSVCVNIQGSYKGVLSVTRDDNDNVTVARDASYNTVAKPSYISDTIVSVVDPGDNLDSSADDTDLMNAYTYDAKYEKETYRILYYDLNVNFESITKTVIEDVRTRNNDGTWSAFNRTVTQQVDNGDVLTLQNESQITNSVITIFKYLGENNEANGTKWTYSEINNLSSQIFYNSATNTNVSSSAICSTLTTELVELYHILDYGITETTTIQLDLEIDEDITTGTYYKYKDYIIIPVLTGVPENEHVVYVVKKIGSNTVYFVDTTTQLTTVNQEVQLP